MKCRNLRHIAFSACLTLAILLSSGQVSLGRPSVGSAVARGIGSVTGAASGVIGGAQAGASQGAAVGASRAAQIYGGESRSDLSIQNPDGPVYETSASGFARSESGSGFAGSQAQASIYMTTTGRPEGLLGRVREALKERDSDREQDKSRSSATPMYDSTASASAAVQQSGSSSVQASASSSVQQQTQKSEGIIGRIADGVSKLAERGKQTVKEVVEPKSRENDNVSKKDEREQNIKKDYQKSEQKQEGAMTSIISKSADVVKEGVQRLEDSAQHVGEKVTKALNDGVVRPLQAGATSSSSNRNNPEKSSQGAQASAQVQVQAQSSDKNKSHSGDKSVATEMFDQFHDELKKQTASLIKPVDQTIHTNTKDQLFKAADSTHEMLREPLSLISKPVDDVLKGAFKTTDEEKREQEKQLMTKSLQERMEVKKKEEKEKKEDRSILSNIAEKAIDLYMKPIEIVLKPVDHMLGNDKNGQQNLIVKGVKEVYGAMRGPLDSVVKPVEKVLKQMGGDYSDKQLYEVSLRFQNKKDNDDPKLATRLANGAINIYDRLITKPLEIITTPLIRVTGNELPGKKNPIVEATRDLNNAAKTGVELFTKPIDRILKEIAQLGDKDRQEARKEEDTSRLVIALDKIHQAQEAPLEIVLRPINAVLGLNRNGKEKGPALKIWDFIHRVLTTPIQVISKPIEDAIFKREKPQRKQQQNGASVQADASASSGAGAKASASVNVRTGTKKPEKPNVITDSIKRVGMVAAEPIVSITSPIRHLIAGEDDKSGQNKLQGGKQPDKIMKTLDKINNVMLEPLKIASQPVSDLITNGQGTLRGGSQSKSQPQTQVQVQAQAQSNGQGAKQSSSQSQVQVQGNQAQVQSQSQTQGQGQSSSQSSAQVQGGSVNLQSQSQAQS